MGVIKRQGIKQSLVNYLAVIVGAISTLFIYPLDTETVGLARFLIDGALFLGPFLMLGFNGVGIRFFPYFKDEANGHRGFLSLLLSGVLLGCLIFVALVMIFRESILDFYADKPPVYLKYLPYFIPLAILMAFIQLLTSWSANFKRIVVPSVFQNLIKLTLPTLVLLFYWQQIALSQVVQGILLNFVLVFLGLVVYIYYLGQLKLKPLVKQWDRKVLRDAGKYAVFGLFVGIGHVLALRIDSIMIATYIDLSSNGVYTIAAFIGNAIAIPTNAVNQITAPIVAEAFRDKDHLKIKQLYQQSSINLLVVGLLIFVGVVVSVDDLFALMPKSAGLQAGILVVVFIGFSKVVDMGTSINNQIINYSPYYRFGFYAILLMAVFNVGFNYLLIQRMGIIGVALATMCSLALYNLIKLLFIWYRLNMQPFTRSTLYTLGVACLSFMLAFWLPDTGYALLNIVLRSIVVLVSYVGLVLYFRLAPDVSEVVQQLWVRITGRR